MRNGGTIVEGEVCFALPVSEYLQVGAKLQRVQGHVLAKRMA
jgi:hypothetical protein